MAKNQPGGRPDLGERMQPRKNKYAAPVGTLFLLLMLIGLISVAVFCVNFTRAMLDNSGEKEEFGRIIAPVPIKTVCAFSSRCTRNACRFTL